MTRNQPSKIYRVLVKIYYFVINPFRYLYWFLVRPKTRGVKCVIMHDGKILLERISYAHKKWTIPGGGVKKNETLEDAARREAKEEVGIELGGLEKIFEYTNTHQFKIDTVTVFKSEVSDEKYEVDGLEILEAGWFSRDNLPENRVPRVDKLLDLFGLV